MEKGVLLKADVHEGGFEAIFQVANLAFVNAADEPFLGGALDGELLEPAIFADGHAGFEGLGVDDDFFVHLLLRLHHLLDLGDDPLRGVFECRHEALGPFNDIDGLEVALLLGVDLLGRLEVRLTVVVATGGLGRVLGLTLGWEAGGEIF